MWLSPDLILTIAVAYSLVRSASHGSDDDGLYERFARSLARVRRARPWAEADGPDDPRPAA